jgi:hypothetical protein
MLWKNSKASYPFASQFQLNNQKMMFESKLPKKSQSELG